MKEYLKKKGISIYALAGKSGVPYSTLNDLVNGKVDASNCKAGMLNSVAHALDLSMDETYRMLCGDKCTVRNTYDIEVTVNVRNKSYYAEFLYGDKPVDLLLCKVNGDSSFYVNDIAKWRSEGYIRDRRMEEF